MYGAEQQKNTEDACQGPAYTKPVATVQSLDAQVKQESTEQQLHMGIT